MLVKEFLFHSTCSVRNGNLLKTRVSENESALTKDYFEMFKTTRLMKVIKSQFEPHFHYLSNLVG